MSGTKRVILCFLFLSLVLFASSSALEAAPQCVITTIPKEVVFSPDWFGGIKLYSSADAVNRGNHVDTWVESTNLPCPPYTWVLTQSNGNGFSVSKTETTSDLETVQLSADPTACGSCTITVTDASNSQSIAGFRCPDSGQWSEIGDICTLCGSGAVYFGCAHGYGYQYNGGYRWKLGNMWWCLTPIGTEYWGNSYCDADCTGDPSCGNPVDCASYNPGMGTCTKTCVPFHAVKEQWTCP